METKAVDPLRQRTLLGVVYTGSRGVFTAVLRVITMAILARILTPSDFGLVAAVLVLQELTMMVIHKGVADALVQREDVSETDFGTAMSVLVAASLLTFAAFWFLAPWIETVLSLPGAAAVTRVAATLIPIEAMVQFYLSDARRRLEFRRIAFVDALASVIGYTLISIVMAVLGFGLWALIGGIIAQAFLRLVGLGSAACRRHRPAFSMESVRRLFTFSALTSIQMITGEAVKRVDRIVLARFLGAEQVGFFSRAGSFMAMFIEFYALPVNQVLFPVLAKLQNQRMRILQAYRHAAAFSALLGLPSAFAVMLMAEPLVAVMFGDQWGPMVPLVHILGANIFFVIIGQPFISIVRGLGELRESVVLTTLQMALIVAGTIAMYPYGLEAVAWCIMSVYAFGFVASTLILAFKLRTSVWALLTPMRAGVLYTILLVFLWLVLEFGAGLSPDTFLGAGVFIALAGGAFCGLFLRFPRWFLGHDLIWLHEVAMNLFRRTQQKSPPGAGQTIAPAE
ncbi:MAG: oligosaccharide flippase family protein [Hyphomicrobiales bacterium]|nr:oligosaccharide flippase family protein [Hyphomicrobiales bacterium]